MWREGGERRRGERRRIASDYPAERERRRGDRRRKFLAGAGLLAAMATAMPRISAHLRARRASAAEQSGPRLPAAAARSAPAESGPGPDPPERAPYERLIQEAASAHDLSADLLRAVIEAESQFDPFAVSPVGARGLMQLMPRTARMLGVDDVMDPRENVLGGARYLSMLLDRFEGNVALALAGYNAGPTVVARHKGIPPYGETRGYVAKIHRLVADTEAAFPLPKPTPPRRVRSRRARAAVAVTRSASARVRDSRKKTTAAKKTRATAAKSKARSTKSLVRVPSKARSKKATGRSKARRGRVSTPAPSRRVRRS